MPGEDSWYLFELDEDDGDEMRSIGVMVGEEDDDEEVDDRARRGGDANAALRPNSA